MMTKEAFESIMRGVEDVIAIAEGRADRAWVDASLRDKGVL